MRQKIKSIGIALMMILTMAAMTACGSKTEDSDTEVSAEIVESLKSTEDGLLASLAMFGDEEIAMYLDSDDSFPVSAMQAWSENKDELGAYVGIKDIEVVLDDDIYVATADVQFEKADATVLMNVDASTGYPTYMSMEVQYSFGEQMKQAGLNTLMGLGVVFTVLAFLILIISMFKYIGRIGEKSEQAEKETPKAIPAAAPVSEDEELVNDTELVAVIAAAIAASENTSTDSFVVRSIRRKPNNKWQRA